MLGSTVILQIKSDSIVQLAEQPSPLSLLPSSHCD
jgi:hypothetical protein